MKFAGAFSKNHLDLGSELSRRESYQQRRHRHESGRDQPRGLCSLASGCNL